MNEKENQTSFSEFGPSTHKKKKLDVTRDNTQKFFK
jgi:hypothetical protein